MTITFERRTDRPDAAGRCTIHLWVYFDNQRLRFATWERCLASEWHAERNQFRRSFAGAQEANEYLQSLCDRLHAHYRQMRAAGGVITPEVLKEVLSPPVVAKPVAEVEVPVFWLTDLYVAYQAALLARGNLAQSLDSVASTLVHLKELEKSLKKQMQLGDYDLAMHDKFLAYLHETRKLAQNTVCKTVKHVKAFLRYVREDQRMPVPVESREMKIKWTDVEKVYLSADELALLENSMLPSSLVATRDAFLFCCYTGLRHSDLMELSKANIKTWDGGRVLRLTQTKTRTAVSIYLMSPAAALLDKYEGTRAQLLPATSN